MESRKCLQGPSFSPPGRASGLTFQDDPRQEERIRLIPKMIGQLFAAICLFAGTAVPPAEGQILSPRLQTLLELLPYEEEIPVLLYIPDLPLGSLKAVVSKGQNRSRVREALKAHAEQTQPLVRTILHRKGAKRIQSFYLLNRVAAFVKAGENDAGLGGEETADAQAATRPVRGARRGPRSHRRTPGEGGRMIPPSAHGGGAGALPRANGQERPPSLRRPLT